MRRLIPRFQLFLVVGLLWLAGCGGSSTLEGGTPAPPIGPVQTGVVTMRVDLPAPEAPQESVQASSASEPRLVVVQVQAPSPTDPTQTVIVAQGQVQAQPEERSVRMRIPDVPPGNYNVVAGLFDLQGNLLPNVTFQPISLEPTENLELVLDLNNPNVPVPPTGNITIIID